MSRRRLEIGFADYQSALAREGEIEIGARARARRRRALIVAAFGVVLIGAAWWLYCAMRPTAVDIPDGDYFRVKVECIHCGYRGVLNAKPGERFPLTCPECKNRSCQRLWRCLDCGHEFIPSRPPRTPRETMTSRETIRCPMCGSARVGSAAASAP